MTRNFDSSVAPGMSPSDLRKWAKEEIRDAIDEAVARIVGRASTGDRCDADEEHALRRERDRVINFLGFDAVAKATLTQPPQCKASHGVGNFPSENRRCCILREGHDGEEHVDFYKERWPVTLPTGGRIVRCPALGCTFQGTDDEVDDHRVTGVHNDLPQGR